MSDEYDDELDAADTLDEENLTPYASLVMAVVRGLEIDAQWADAVLARSGKTFNDVLDDAGRIARTEALTELSAMKSGHELDSLAFIYGR